MDSSVAPGRVFSSQPHNELAYHDCCWRPTATEYPKARIGPASCLWVPRMSSEPLTWTVVTATAMPKMDHGTLLPVHRLCPCTPTGPPFGGRTTGPGYRSRDSPPRGRRLTPTGGASCPAASGPSSLGRTVAASFCRSPRPILRSTRDPASMAPTSGEAEVDVLASRIRTTGIAGRHGLHGPPPGKRELDLAVSPNSRGAGHDGSATGSLEHLGNPSPAPARDQRDQRANQSTSIATAQNDVAMDSRSQHHHW